MSEELPPNWRSAKDSDGKEYYFNGAPANCAHTPKSELPLC